MAAPEYVPVVPADLPRRTTKMPPSPAWTPERPGDLNGPQPKGPRLGHPGPDQGYALTLAERFRDQLTLVEGEHADDAIAGCVAVAMRRAATFGRAPVIHDLEHAFTLWGFLGEPPPELVGFRRSLFESARHHYWDQREIVDLVPESTLRLTPAEVRARLSDWKSLLLDAS
jgi:hypothetical protein